MERYETIQKISTGSYGVVYLCRDKHDENGALVAIKVFLEANNHSQILKSAVREASLLELCRGQPHVVQMHQAYRSESGRIYLVLEYLPTVLSSVIAESVPEGGLAMERIWNILYQLTKAVKSLHKQQIIHRDLKPSNIMFNKNHVLKIIDLGLARQCKPHKDALTAYVQTRWYRSPELLLAMPYGFEVDIWAIGCIAAELTLGTPLFPGRSHPDQLHLILKCLGTLLPRRYKEALQCMVDSGKLMVPNQGEVTGLLAKFSKGIPDELFTFITTCLQLDPLKRPSAEELLCLPHFKRFTNTATSTEMVAASTAASPTSKGVAAGATTSSSGRRAPLDRPRQHQSLSGAPSRSVVLVGGAAVRAVSHGNQEEAAAVCKSFDNTNSGDHSVSPNKSDLSMRRATSVSSLGMSLNDEAKAASHPDARVTLLLPNVTAVPPKIVVKQQQGQAHHTCSEMNAFVRPAASSPKRRSLSQQVSIKLAEQAASGSGAVEGGHSGSFALMRRSNSRSERDADDGSNAANAQKTPGAPVPPPAALPQHDTVRTANPSQAAASSSGTLSTVATGMSAFQLANTPNLASPASRGARHGLGRIPPSVNKLQQRLLESQQKASYSEPLADMGYVAPEPPGGASSQSTIFRRHKPSVVGSLGEVSEQEEFLESNRPGFGGMSMLVMGGKDEMEEEGPPKRSSTEGKNPERKRSTLGLSQMAAHDNSPFAANAVAGGTSSLLHSSGRQGSLLVPMLHSSNTGVAQSSEGGVMGGHATGHSPPNSRGHSSGQRFSWATSRLAASSSPFTDPSKNEGQVHTSDIPSTVFSGSEQQRSRSSSTVIFPQANQGGSGSEISQSTALDTSAAPAYSISAAQQALLRSRSTHVYAAPVKHASPAPSSTGGTEGAVGPSSLLASRMSRDHWEDGIGGRAQERGVAAQVGLRLTGMSGLGFEPEEFEGGEGDQYCSSTLDSEDGLLKIV